MDEALDGANKILCSDVMYEDVEDLHAIYKNSFETKTLEGSLANCSLYLLAGKHRVSASDSRLPDNLSLRFIGSPELTMPGMAH